jgi:aspartyl-tRNA synthetase
MCGALRKKNAGEQVTLMGWVDRRRDHGGLIFVDLRDRDGVTQVVFNPEESPEAFKKAKEIRAEYVLAVRGPVAERPAGLINPNIPTGEVEVHCLELKILNPAETPPLPVSGPLEAGEEHRLKYRYLDLRRPAMQRNLLLRHRLYQVVRRYLDEQGFVEIETPMLMRSTPEGARDFLVPSRIHPGKFYALPQSPQTYKQILMVAGYDRYFQITKCFRDEDLRADRQPEFTQIDLEMSFVERQDVMALVEGLMAAVFEQILGRSIETPVPRLTYEEALSRFGSDKPDLRFDLELADVTSLAAESEFKVFRDVASSGGVVAGICVPGGAKYSRKEVDELTQVVTEAGGKGLAAIKVAEAGWDSNLAKFFSDELVRRINGAFAAGPGDLLLLVADERERALTLLGGLRLHLGRREGLIADDEYRLVWVIDFPWLEFDERENRYIARHHPFTAPMDEDLSLIDSAPERIRAKAYDLVLNGNEIAGGSIRIHQRDLQRQMFKLLNIGEEEAQDKFGFLLDAFRYGAPPHGGIAFGFDRLAMILAGEKSIREVIAFPKTNTGLSLMDGSPSEVDPNQLEELHLRTI